MIIRATCIARVCGLISIVAGGHAFGAIASSPDAGYNAALQTSGYKPDSVLAALSGAYNSKIGGDVSIFTGSDRKSVV